MNRALQGSLNGIPNDFLGDTEAKAHSHVTLFEMRDQGFHHQVPFLHSRRIK